MPWFKPNPIAKLEKELARKLELATEAQRRGKLHDFADLSAEAEELGRRLDALREGE